jgi:hypothetical protein
MLSTSQRSALSVKATYQMSKNTSIKDSEIRSNLIKHNHSSARTLSPIIKLDQPLIPDTVLTIEKLELGRHNIEHHAISITASVVILLILIAAWTMKKRFGDCCNKCCGLGRSDQTTILPPTAASEQQGRGHDSRNPTSLRVWTTTLDQPREHVQTEQKGLVIIPTERKG